MINTYIDSGEDYPVFWIVEDEEDIVCEYHGKIKLPKKLKEQFIKIQRLNDAMQDFLYKKYYTKK